MRKRLRRRLWWTSGILLLALILAYVGSYLVLSRRGFAQSEALGLGRDGFYFFPPQETASWRAWNYGCVRFYYPLIVLDVWLGTGRDVYCEPLWRLSG